MWYFPFDETIFKDGIDQINKVYIPHTTTMNPHTKIITPGVSSLPLYSLQSDVSLSNEIFEYLSKRTNVKWVLKDVNKIFPFQQTY